MQFTNFFILLAWAQTALADPTQPTAEITLPPRNYMDESSRKSILKIENNLRRRVIPEASNLVAVTWGYEFERDLQKVIATRGGKALYTKDPYFAPGPPYTYHKNDWGMYQFMKWLELAAKYANNSDYITHDTCNNGRIVSIFKYRIPRQVKCFDYDSCSKTTYSNYDSCVKPSLRNTNTDRWGQMQCTYATEFVFRLLWPFEKMACVYAGVPGLYTPNNQNNAFVCYYKAQKLLNFSNDIVYERGSRASNCTSPYPTPYKGLCTNKLPAKVITRLRAGL